MGALTKHWFYKFRKCSAKVTVRLGSLESHRHEIIDWRSEKGWIFLGNVQYSRGRVDDNIILHIIQTDSSDKELHGMVGKYFSIDSFDEKNIDRK